MDAVCALAVYETGVEPQGWYRNRKTGRRRPGGDAEREYVNF